jgi:DNA-binding NtrC family response regulator
MKRLCSEKKKKIDGIDREVMSAFCEYQWPGNIRELENLIERLIIIKGSGIITIEDLPCKYVGKAPVETHEEFHLPSGCMDFNSVIEGFEKRLITEALQKSGGNKKEAAQMLSLKRTTFIEKLKKMDNYPESSAAYSY